MTESWDDDDLAIARALGVDALSNAEHADASAVADYEEVLAHLPFDEVPPPAGLEDRVVAAALARRPAAVRSIDTGRKAGGRSRGRSTTRWIGAAAATVAAAVIVVVLLAGRPPTGPTSPAARIQPAAATDSVERVLADPDTRQGVLRAANGAPGGRVALDPRGSGYLTGLRLAPATSSWLWLDTDSGPVRVGEIPGAANVHFDVRGDIDAVRGVIVSAASTAPQPVRLRASLSK